MTHITPTPGRIVWYRAGKEIAAHHHAAHDQPLSAIVVGVHSNREVNLLVHGFDGSAHPRLNVPLKQIGEPVAPGEAQWMPYQQGQAQRAAELEGKIKAQRAAELEGKIKESLKGQPDAKAEALRDTAKNETAAADQAPVQAQPVMADTTQSEPVKAETEAAPQV